MDSEFCCRHGGNVERIERPSVCNYQYAKNICTCHCGNSYSTFIKSYPWINTGVYSGLCTKEMDGCAYQFSTCRFVRKNDWHSRHGWNWLRNSQATSLRL